MLTRKYVQFLLVFLTTSGIPETITSSATTGSSSPKTTKPCEHQEIGKKKLEVDIKPINFRNTYDNHQKNKQVLLKLSVGKHVKNCMDGHKFNLTISLNETVSEHHDEVKVSSTATQHIVKIGRKSLEIESCDDSVVDKLKTEHDLKESLGLNKKKNKNKHQELIYFIAPSQIWDIKDKVVNITVTFDESKKKRSCDYRECSEISFFS